MALNFLRRKKSAQKSILLYNYLNLSNQANVASQTDVRSGNENVALGARGLPREERPRKSNNEREDFWKRMTILDLMRQDDDANHPSLGQSSSSEVLTSQSRPQASDEKAGKLDTPEAASQKWEKVKGRIESLLAEISESGRELAGAGRTVPGQRRDNTAKSSGKVSVSEHRRVQSPLDVHELQSVAAMARRLKSHAKLKSNSTEDFRD